MIEKTGSARWQGGLKDGKGTIATQSGALNGHPYGFNTRFEGQRGTNPEELIGAAHAACFSMALSGVLAEAGITPGAIETTATVSLEKVEGGFAITKVHLDTRITAEGDEAQIQECAKKAKAGCPVSKVLNAEITLTASVG
jgi:osmotically inducible protein OsmC